MKVYHVDTIATAHGEAWTRRLGWRRVDFGPGHDTGETETCPVQTVVGLVSTERFDKKIFLSEYSLWKCVLPLVLSLV